MVTYNTDTTMAAANSITTSDNHNLNIKWNLWAHLPQDPDWSVKSYKPIYKFTNLEETIAVTETLPESLIQNCMLFIMKDGVVPMWEDSKNRNGGSF